MPTAGATLDALDLVIHNDVQSQQDIVVANALQPVSLRSRAIDDLMAFLHALTDLNSLDVRAQVPLTVPSGLPIAD